jgi:hypothetical protein
MRKRSTGIERENPNFSDIESISSNLMQERRISLSRKNWPHGQLLIYNFVESMLHG